MLQYNDYVCGYITHKHNVVWLHYMNIVTSVCINSMYVCMNVPPEVVSEGVEEVVGRARGRTIGEVVDMSDKSPREEEVLFIWNKPILK